MKRPWMAMGIFLLLGGFAIQAGCGSRGIVVNLSPDRYTPRLDDSARIYKGAAIWLDSFTNRADNTTWFSYSSSDKYYTYAASSPIQSYLWYCFRNALLDAGMRVYEDNPPEGTPKAGLTMLSMNDHEFTFDVEVTKSAQLLYRKNYTVTAPATESTDLVELEDRAFRLIDAAVSRLLKDTGFQAALLGKSI